MATTSGGALIPGTFNSRDLGGLPGRGGHLRRGRLIRSDAPVGLGEAGRAVLGDLGVRTLLDLREPTEIENGPADVDGREISVLSRPLFGGIAVHAESTLDGVYDDLIDHRGEAFARAVVAVAEAADAPVVLYCSAGKDRTGLLAALILSLLGVNEADIIADYHLTEENLKAGPFRERVLAAARLSGLTEQQIAVNLGAPRQLMRRVLERLGEQGGAEAYLMRHGLPAAASETLRAQLLEP